MSSGGMSRDMGAFSAESSADSESWHQTLVEEVARRAERHAEQLETRFRERMEMSLSFELAKIDAASKRHADTLPPGPGQRRGEARGASAADDLNVEESFERLHHLRRRYRQLQGPEKAHLTSDELRTRLSRFYECMCPSKLNNVPRIVSSFEARGGTSQALWDLNSELLCAYGQDLESIAPCQIEALACPPPPAGLHHYPADDPSQVIFSRSAVRSVANVHNATPPVATRRTAHTLQERLAMLSDEALVEARQASQRLPPDRINTEGHATMPNYVTRSNPASQPNPSMTLHDDSRFNSLTSHSPQQRRAQNSHQVAHHIPASAGGIDTDPSSNFVGMPSPRWAGNFLGQARAKYQYTARHADELSFSAGDVVQITGMQVNLEVYWLCVSMRFLEERTLLWQVSVRQVCGRLVMGLLQRFQGPSSCQLCRDAPGGSSCVWRKRLPINTRCRQLSADGTWPPSAPAAAAGLAVISAQATCLLSNRPHHAGR